MPRRVIAVRPRFAIETPLRLDDQVVLRKGNPRQRSGARKNPHRSEESFVSLRFKWGMLWRT